MRVGLLWAPLVRRSTFRRGVLLLLGGVVLFPYFVLTVGFVQMFTDPETPFGPIAVLAVITVVIAGIPPFLPATRTLSITAARALLDVDLPDPSAHPPWESRLLAAGWYGLHLVAGGIALTAVLVAMPLSVLLVAGEVDWLSGGWAVLAAVGALVAAGYLVAALGALLTMFAPLLLGPSPAELRAAMERQAERFAQRNRLARELHDSVGHALTVTTLQAAAARRVLDSDPEFARRALLAVEETGRAAMNDLDHVLGLLRADTDDGSGTAPQPGLTDVAGLVHDLRATGVEIDATVEGDLTALPPVVSREAYRIVQEGLTNAVRHGRPGPVVLHVRAGADGLDVELTNPLPAGPRTTRAGGGRGLRGMRERVRLLQGRMSAAADGDRFRVQVHLPGRPEGGPT